MVSSAKKKRWGSKKKKKDGVVWAENSLPPIRALSFRREPFPKLSYIWLHYLDLVLGIKEWVDGNWNPVAELTNVNIGALSEELIVEEVNDLIFRDAKIPYNIKHNYYINYRTFQRYKAKVKKGIDKINTSLEFELSYVVSTFCRLVMRWQRILRKELYKKIWSEERWQRSAYLLERKFPKEFKDPYKVLDKTDEKLWMNPEKTLLTLLNKVDEEEDVMVEWTIISVK